MPSSVIKNYFDDPTFSDLTIRLSDRTVNAHRIVLCRKSEYFKTLLTGHFKESGAREIELHEDDPQAMVALLRHIYDLPYQSDGSDGSKRWPTGLDSHAVLYVTAGKYLNKELQTEVTRSMSYITRYYHNRGMIDNVPAFIAALRNILTCTSSQEYAREVMVKTCIKNIKLLQKEREFLSLLRECSDLGAEILGHRELECAVLGSWMCSKSCKEKDTEPMCPVCFSRFGPEEAWDYRQSDSWWCSDCQDSTNPICATCEEGVVWLQRGVR